MSYIVFNYGGRYDAGVLQKFYCHRGVRLHSGRSPEIDAGPARSLSNQLKAMERDYGAPLAVRGTRGITLTPEGEILYQKAKSIVALDDAARNDIQSSFKGVSGTLSVALPPTNSSGFLSDAFSRYCRLYPKVQLQLHELTSDEVARCVQEGIAEIGFLRAPIHDPERFDFFALPKEPIAAFLPEAHPLAGKESLCAEDLKGVPLITSRGCIIPIRELCASHAFEPELTCVTTSRTVALHMAAIISHCALVPVGDGNTQPGFVMRRFASEIPTLPRVIIVQKNTTLSLQAKNLLELVRTKIAFFEKT